MNYSGFSGYGIKSIYPNMGTVTQSDDTRPEAEEQQAYTQIDSDTPTPAVDSGTKINMFVLLGGIVLLIVLFGKQ